MKMVVYWGESEIKIPRLHVPSCLEWGAVETQFFVSLCPGDGEEGEQVAGGPEPGHQYAEQPRDPGQPRPQRVAQPSIHTGAAPDCGWLGRGIMALLHCLHSSIIPHHV